MRVYLDLCCLKRPFDLQEQPLIRLQTEAVLSILALPPDSIEFLQGQALVLENSLNPVPARRDAVALWLSEAVAVLADDASLAARTAEIIAKGFKSFDAFHLASAELAGATIFLTVDRELLKLASRLSGELHVPVSDPIHFIEEIS